METRKVHTIIAPNQKIMALKYKEFEKQHEIVDVKYLTERMMIVFYRESLRFIKGSEEVEQIQTSYARRNNAYRRNEE